MIVYNQKAELTNNITMKSYRSAEQIKQQNMQKYGKYVPVERKGYSPNGNHGMGRVGDYDQLAKKAKQQLKEFQNKRKISPENQRFQRTSQDHGLDRAKKAPENKNNPSPKNLQHSQSQKLIKKQQTFDRDRFSPKDRDSKHDYKELSRHEKLSADGKTDSPRKKNYIDSNQYKKLHEKLDIIETKITDMKRNLQKKKEEKQKHQQNKYKTQKQNQNKKSGLKDLVTKVPQHSDLHTFNSNPYSPRHNVYYVSQLTRAYKDEQSLARQHLLNSLNILKMLEKSRRMTEVDLRKVMLNLPFKKGYEDKKTVVFDLDETLIHCNDNLNPPYDVKLPIKFPTGEIIEAGINIRPYSKQILKNLSKYFEVIVFTASHACYANVVIDHLDPKNEWVHHRLFRQHCYLSPEGMYVKDLRIINRELKNMVLVDNAAYSYAYQLNNGIPIFPYYHGHVDFQLKMLEDYIMKMVFAKDVREINQSTFKLPQYKNYYSRPEKLVQDLYLNQ